MGRKKFSEENKKRTITLNIETELYKKFEKLDIKNKSRFFNWLLGEHFNFLKEKEK